MHLFAALLGWDVMGSNKDLIHSFITGGNIDLIACIEGSGVWMYLKGSTDADCTHCLMVSGFVISQNMQKKNSKFISTSALIS